MSNQAEHRAHPQRRHGLFRPRLLRRRDRDAQPRPARRATACASRSSTTPRAAVPSRASMLTGLHPHQTGVGILTYDSGPEGYAGNLNKRCVTIPQALKTNGYKTYMSGKWHVASSLTKPTDTWPLQRGFDEFFGTIIGAGSFYDPNTLTRGNDNIEHEAKADSTLLLHRRHQRPGRRLHRQAPPRNAGHAVLHLRRLHGAALAAACARRGHRQVQGPLRQGLGQAARRASRQAGRVGHPRQGVEAERSRSDAAAVDRGRAQGVAAALHGGLCGADRPHGPGHRPHRRRAGEDRPARQHRRHLPGRQRRLRRGHSRRT